MRVSLACYIHGLSKWVTTAVHLAVAAFHFRAAAACGKYQEMKLHCPLHLSPKEVGRYHCRGYHGSLPFGDFLV